MPLWSSSDQKKALPLTNLPNANLALILVDARNGVIEQTKLHTFIASLLQIPRIFVCINKMDLLDYSQEAYDKVVKEYTDFAAKLDVKDVRFVPMSALHSDNVVSRGDNMDWYEGGTLLRNLETVHISTDDNLRDCRFPVQTVIHHTATNTTTSEATPAALLVVSSKREIR